MKKSYTLVAFALATCVAQAQTPGSFVAQAERGSAMMSTTTIEQTVSRNRWFKRQTRLTEFHYDVLKTNSVLTPLVGVINGVLVEFSSEHMDSEAEAQAAEVATSKPTLWRVELRFHPDAAATRWIFASGRTVVTSPNGDVLLDEPLKAEDVAAGTARLAGRWAKAVADAVK